MLCHVQAYVSSPVNSPSLCISLIQIAIFLVAILRLEVLQLEIFRFIMYKFGLLEIGVHQSFILKKFYLIKIRIKQKIFLVTIILDKLFSSWIFIVLDKPENTWFHVLLNIQDWDHTLIDILPELPSTMPTLTDYLRSSIEDSYARSYYIFGGTSPNQSALPPS